ncbi:alpha-ketoglutarate-dependent dioxygenase AlkB [Psychroserpens sp. MEBiC05023]
MEGIIYRENFISHHRSLFEALKNNTIWDESMTARKTASFGRPYNYSQIVYPFQEFTQDILEIIDGIEDLLGFRTNNCLVNYYENGNSTMGFHSDQRDMLEDDTGVVIVSIGATRTLRFRTIEDKSITRDFDLNSGSLIYMNNEVQHIWQHAVIRSNTKNGRMSLTFRKLK